jgi:hypothetical protein
VDLSKLTTGDKVIAVSGIALLVVSFLSWFEGTVELGSVDVSAGTKSAWGVPLGILGVVVGLALTAFTLLPALGVELPPGLTSTRMALILGTVTFAAILIVVLFSSITVEGVPDDAVDTSRKIGAFLGIVAAAGVLAGAILKRKEGGAFRPPAARPAPPAA